MMFMKERKRQNASFAMRPVTGKMNVHNMIPVKIGVDAIHLETAHTVTHVGRIVETAPFEVDQAHKTDLEDHLVGKDTATGMREQI